MGNPSPSVGRIRTWYCPQDHHSLPVLETLSGWEFWVPIVLKDSDSQLVLSYWRGVGTDCSCLFILYLQMVVSSHSRTSSEKHYTSVGPFRVSLPLIIAILFGRSFGRGWPSYSITVSIHFGHWYHRCFGCESSWGPISPSWDRGCQIVFNVRV